MKVSSVKTTITSDELLNIMNEYVKVDGVLIHKIEINELVHIYGTVQKGLKMPFRASVGIGIVRDNKLNVKILQFKLGKCTMIKSIQNVLFHKAMDVFLEEGISVDKDTLHIELEYILRKVPFLFFKINKINLSEGQIEIEAENISYMQKNEVLVGSEGKTEDAEYNGGETKKALLTMKEKKGNMEREKKIEDCYSKARKKLLNKAPSSFNEILEYAMCMPDIFMLFWRLFKDKRVPLNTKLLVGGVLAYLISPFDIFPEFIPFLGELDDIAVTFFALNKIINDIPEEIILENWSGNNTIILKVKEAVAYLYNMIGSTQASKIIRGIDILAKSRKKEGEKI